MDTIEEKIKELVKSVTGTEEEKARAIQHFLFFDFDQHVPLSFIKTHME